MENEAVHVILSEGPEQGSTHTEKDSHLKAELYQAAGTAICHRHENDHHYTDLSHIHCEVGLLAVIVLFVFE